MKRRPKRTPCSFSLLAAMAAAVGLAGCSAPTGPPGPTGTLIGTLRAAGGPSGSGGRALRGQVTFSELDGSRKFSVTVGASGRFSVPAPVGTYTASGSSPEYEGGTGLCRASERVVVTKDATSRVQVDCQEM